MSGAVSSWLCTTRRGSLSKMALSARLIWLLRPLTLEFMCLLPNAARGVPKRARTEFKQDDFLLYITWKQFGNVCRILFKCSTPRGCLMFHTIDYVVSALVLLRVCDSNCYEEHTKLQLHCSFALLLLLLLRLSQHSAVDNSVEVLHHTAWLNLLLHWPASLWCDEDL